MQAIFFDANGVLYYRVDKHGPMRTFLTRNQLPVPSAATVHQATLAVRWRAFVGAISKAAYYDAVLAAWRVTDPKLRAEGHCVQDAAQAAICLNAGVPETLPALKARGFKLGIVTNSVAATSDKLRWFRDSGLTVAWDAVANSVEIGVCKETNTKWGLRPVARHRRQFRSGSGHQHHATIRCVLAKNEARRSSDQVSPHFVMVSV